MYNLAVFIAVETVPLLEINTTFHDLGLDEMDEELRIVHRHYQNDPSYHGVAVHHLMNWKAMKESVKRN
ncbi:hypothetical protein [Alkalihalobacillus sp. BA299]|uniref:hypothetical protein n=1 Tax=Alkalihalobacillus sp. BA299 TaxID=2815938 RepID=UPI001ADA9A6B|nr:hypothetical protein [Alkalihalobacillus sp. BA299]